jgi:hypothetical protein
LSVRRPSCTLTTVTGWPAGTHSRRVAAASNAVRARPAQPPALPRRPQPAWLQRQAAQSAPGQHSSLRSPGCSYMLVPHHALGFSASLARAWPLPLTVLPGGHCSRCQVHTAHVHRRHTQQSQRGAVPGRQSRHLLALRAQPTGSRCVLACQGASRQMLAGPGGSMHNLASNVPCATQSAPVHAPLPCGAARCCTPHTARC